ncbi:hypothetical protein Q2K19_06700 [Micromonospora soli]|uniref:hypothetical protein n=1 Tax=Micromonospora sp. NBRC 110009 TaxID=3061627 RepID=UPI002673AEC5|nr:hypothetical protein [Micromonospora sp. NBRC 110009]WKU00171.1 hypothetical protein Q2K19_06700 [Micromonospora sp. NBRC 110009]
MRARRLIAAASVAAVAVLSLAACGRSAPDVAVYVGDTSYSIDRVDAIRDEAATAYAAVVKAAEEQGQTVPAERRQLDLDGQDVVNLLVGLDLGKRIVAEKHLQLADGISATDIGQALNVPDTEYAKLAAEWYDVFYALGQGLPKAELSDVDRTAVYEALVKANVAPPGWSVEEQRQAFADPTIAPQVSAVVGLSEALKAEVDRQDVQVNPRYPALAVPALLQLRTISLYDLPYVDGADQVTDISTPEPEVSDSTEADPSTGPATT